LRPVSERLKEEAVNEPEMTIGMNHEIWSEESPYRIPSRKLGMWLFILSDAVTFGAILYAYAFVRTATADWTRPFEVSSIVNGVVMTIVLLVSSVTMLAALDAAKQNQRSRSVTWLGVTMLLGILFAALHIREWIRMIDEGWRLFQNPTGGPVLFGSTFFCITGLHLMHIIAGVVAIAVVAIKYSRASLNAGHVESVGLYWHFVDLVWMFVFPLVYLMNAR
jgi:cytochrome c oxidase subunit 3